METIVYMEYNIVQLTLSKRKLLFDIISFQT